MNYHCGQKKEKMKKLQKGGHGMLRSPGRPPMFFPLALRKKVQRPGRIKRSPLQRRLSTSTSTSITIFPSILATDGKTKNIAEGGNVGGYPEGRSPPGPPISSLLCFSFFLYLSMSRLRSRSDLNQDRKRNLNWNLKRKRILFFFFRKSPFLFVR